MNSRRTDTPAVGIGCVVLNGDQILLVQDRKDGLWSTPGGHLDHGESLEDCACRETEEETGIRLGEPSFLCVTNDIIEKTGRHYITIWFRAEPAGTEIEIGDGEEILEAGWFPLAELPEKRHVFFENLIAGRSLPADAFSGLFRRS